jgi:UV DNA damage endonuclease
MMKIGYPCLNLSLPCSSSRTFRLRSYSEERLKKTIEENIDCLFMILNFNLEHDILFFRITSDLIPFASHPVCKFNWQNYFKSEFLKLGRIIKSNNMRISMHPDQFTLINSVNRDIFKRSKNELLYHAQVLNLLDLNQSHKIQIHVGGAYGEKNKSIKRFISRYKELPIKIKERLVIENDERIYSLKDCLLISKQLKMPVLLDIFHHSLNNNKENIKSCFSAVKSKWLKKDGVPMVDYSSQEKGRRLGVHAKKLDINLFKNFIKETKEFKFDLMLEIKEKEKSVLKALKLLSSFR